MLHISKTSHRRPKCASQPNCTAHDLSVLGDTSMASTKDRHSHNKGQALERRQAMGTPLSTAGKLILPATQNRCAFAPEWLQQHATVHDVANMKHVGITSHKALGVRVANMRVVGQQLSRTSTKDRHCWCSWCISTKDRHSWCCEFDNWWMCDTL